MPHTTQPQQITHPNIIVTQSDKVLAQRNIAPGPRPPPSRMPRPSSPTSSSRTAPSRSKGRTLLSASTGYRKFGWVGGGGVQGRENSNLNPNLNPNPNPNPLGGVIPRPSTHSQKPTRNHPGFQRTPGDSGRAGRAPMDSPEFRRTPGAEVGDTWGGFVKGPLGELRKT
eukprot:535212-Amorphochlora_amoeboformis.AAC.1